MGPNSTGLSHLRLVGWQIPLATKRQRQQQQPLRSRLEATWGMLLMLAGRELIVVVVVVVD